MPPELLESRMRCVLLDRDGTINFDCGYLSRPEQLQLLPYAAEGLRALSQLGFELVVVTNQSGIGRGYFDEQALQAVHARLRQLLAAEGVRLTAIYHCPHHSEDHCNCRKPAPGMVLRAADELGFDPGQSFMIGDKRCDFELGRAVGAKTILVRGSGNDWEETTTVAEAGQGGIAADFVVSDLREAASAIQRSLQKEMQQHHCSQSLVVFCGEEPS